MTQQPLTDRQRAILKFIEDFISKHNYSPTIREIMDCFGVSPNGVLCHITALAKKGWIKRTRKASRSIVLVKPKGLPLLKLEDGKLVPVRRNGNDTPHAQRLPG